ncbi:DUF3239 domain-containing protein [bacterium]|nr:MAG: DUF3239 domain-containing protein [bacterium]
MRQQLPKDFEQRRDSAKFVSPRAKASNPGDFRVQWTQFLRAFPQPTRGVALCLIILLSATIKFHLFWGIPFLALLLCSLFALQRVKDHFAFGNTLPGVIVSLQPPLIAVLTDMTTGIGKYNTIKVLEQPLMASGLAASPIGTRVPTVATYIGEGKSGHWDDFFPVLVAAVTQDEKAVQRAMASFKEEDWLELECALATLSSPPAPGLHRLGWSLSAEDFAQNRLDRREELHFMSDLTTEPSFRVYFRGEGAPRILHIEWPNPKVEGKRPDPEWVEAANALACRKILHDAVVIDFSRWIGTSPEWVSWWRGQTGGTDRPLALVLSREVIPELNVDNVHSTREAALDWIEAKLASTA